MNCPKCKEKIEDENFCYECNFCIIISSDNIIKVMSFGHIDVEIQYFKYMVKFTKAYSESCFKINSLFYRDEIDECYKFVLKIYENWCLD